MMSTTNLKEFYNRSYLMDVSAMGQMVLSGLTVMYCVVLPSEKLVTKVSFADISTAFENVVSKTNRYKKLRDYTGALGL